MMAEYMEASLREMNYCSDETIEQFMSKLKSLEKDIVEENKSMTLLEKLDNNDFFEPVMNRFIDKMMRDHILGRYF